jgi:hypothetical protein
LTAGGGTHQGGGVLQTSDTQADCYLATPPLSLADLVLVFCAVAVCEAMHIAPYYISQHQHKGYVF